MGNLGGCYQSSIQYTAPAAACGLDQLEPERDDTAAAPPDSRTAEREAVR
jgi:hypothetical protein